jgi:hypothetical protein
MFNVDNFVEMVRAVQEETQARRWRVIMVGGLSAKGHTRSIHAVAAVICHFESFNSTTSPVSFI